MSDPALSPDLPPLAANDNYGSDHPESEAGWRSCLTHPEALAILEDASLHIEEAISWLRSGIAPACLGAILRRLQTPDARPASLNKAAPYQR